VDAIKATNCPVNGRPRQKHGWSEWRSSLSRISWCKLCRNSKQTIRR
jgi:hypothetical protein